MATPQAFIVNDDDRLDDSLPNSELKRLVGMTDAQLASAVDEAAKVFLGDISDDGDVTSPVCALVMIEEYIATLDQSRIISVHGLCKQDMNKMMLSGLIKK